MSRADCETITPVVEELHKPASGRPTVDEVISHVTEVSTLPQVALRVIQVAGDPDAGAADLRRSVECDPSLSARILRCVNSAAYALRCQVTSLQQAISFLGFDQVRNLAITASVSELSKSSEAIGPYRRTALWRHMVSVGICSRLIAARQRFSNFEEIFLAGLLHDLGIILEDQQCHAMFCKVIAALAPDKTLCEVEQSVLGFDHAALGGGIAEVWKFPPSVAAALRYHHSSHECNTNHTAVVHCVEVANLICGVKGVTSVGVKMLKAPHTAMTALGLGKEDVKILVTDLDHELALNQGLFDL
jgi:HD-like signal output (HDOD) protein